MENLYEKYGVKFLLNLKNSKKFDDDDLFKSLDFNDLDIEYNPSEPIEEISDEDYNKGVREIDEMIRDIIGTRQKIRLGKLKDKIKTREDLLNFFNIRDNDNNKLPPEPSDITGYVNKFKVNTDSKQNSDFESIKNKLSQQNIMIKEKEKTNLDAFLITEKNNKTEQDKLFEEIKLADLKCEDMLDDIDDLIKMGEDIDKEIESIKN